MGAGVEPDMVMTKRISRLPHYLFARINALKAQARARGVDIIDLGMGNPDRPPHDFVIDKLCEVAHDPKAHRYSASQGITHLRREMARQYQERYGVSLDPDREVIATIGSKEGLTHLMFAILDEGDVVVVPSPNCTGWDSPSPIPAFVAFGVWVLGIRLTGMSSLGSICGGIVFPIACVILVWAKGEALVDNWPFLAFSLLVSVLLLLRHRANLARILSGTEARFGRSGPNDASSGGDER